MIAPAEILPPQLRAALIVAGLKKDCDEIDAVHRRLRQQYPELFREDDLEEQWSRREARGPKNLHRIK